MDKIEFCLLIPINWFLLQYSMYKVVKMNFEHQIMDLNYVILIITLEFKIGF